MYCSISLNELTPERMRAYGPLSPEAADRLDAIRAELDGLVATAPQCGSVAEY